MERYMISMAENETIVHLDWNSIAMPQVLHYCETRKNWKKILNFEKNIRKEEGKLKRSKTYRCGWATMPASIGGSDRT